MNAELGSDSTGDGSSTSPLQTLNKALQVAADVNAPPLIIVDTIIVQASDVPIAPFEFGEPSVTEGWEQDGWTWPGESPRRPFPIRMQSGINVIGVADSEGNRPRIIIDEIGENAFYTDWTAAPPPPGAEPGTIDDYWCIVAGAGNSRIQGFDIDGSRLIDKSISRWPAIWAANLGDFEVLDCDVHGWHDSCRFQAKADDGVRVRVTDCILRDSFPRGVADDGHAGIWLEGNGRLRLTLGGTAVENCHDGVEVDTRSTGIATVTVANTTKVSRFDRTENGFEVVNLGPATLSIDGAVFVNNHNRAFEGGTPLPPQGASTGAILCRPETTVHTTVRNTRFWNCGFGLVTGVNPASSTNLGTDGNHGLNSFCLDFTDPVMAMETLDPIRVMLFARYPGTVNAAGNWWVAHSQGADASGHLTGPQTFSSHNSPPPGPGAGLVNIVTGLPWRNYSIEIPGGTDTVTIEFGSSPPAGAGPDCSVKP